MLQVFLAFCYFHLTKYLVIVQLFGSCWTLKKDPTTCFLNQHLAIGDEILHEDSFAKVWAVWSFHLQDVCISVFVVAFLTGLKWGGVQLLYDVTYFHAPIRV